MRHKNARIQRGLYKCARTGRTLKADVNNAYNILYGRKVGEREPDRAILFERKNANTLLLCIFQHVPVQQMSVACQKIRMLNNCGCKVNRI